MAALLNTTIGGLTPEDVSRHIKLAKPSLQAQSYFVDALTAKDLFDLHAQAIPHDNKRDHYVDAFKSPSNGDSAPTTNADLPASQRRVAPASTITAAPATTTQSPRTTAAANTVKGQGASGKGRTTKRNSSALTDPNVAMDTTATSATATVTVPSPRGGSGASASASTALSGTATRPTGAAAVPPVVGLPSAGTAPASG